MPLLQTDSGVSAWAIRLVPSTASKHKRGMKRVIRRRDGRGSVEMVVVLFLESIMLFPLNIGVTPMGFPRAFKG